MRFSSQNFLLLIGKDVVLFAFDVDFTTPRCPTHINSFVLNLLKINKINTLKVGTLSAI